MSKKDKHREKTGALFFTLAGAGVSVGLPALFSFAGFLFFIPWLNLAAAILLTPVALTVLYGIFAGRTIMNSRMTRILTAAVSLLGAWVTLCVMTGVLSGVFGAAPVELTDMRETDLGMFLSRTPAVLRNTANYLVMPGLLWQDLAAWNEEGWHIIAAAALFAQAGLPQLFIRRAPNDAAYLHHGA